MPNNRPHTSHYRCITQSVTWRHASQIHIHHQWITRNYVFPRTLCATWWGWLSCKSALWRHFYNCECANKVKVLFPLSLKDDHTLQWYRYNKTNSKHHQSTLIKFIYQVFHRILSNLEFIYESHVQDRSYGLLSYITMFVLVDVNLYLRDVPADWFKICENHVFK